MAKVEFLLQAVTPHNHASLLNKIFSQGFDEAVMSVAFAKTQGVKAVLDSITTKKQKTTIFVGIRNDITSYQALELLLNAGVKIFAVDTGSRTTIFHPKIFIIKNKEVANILIGSANLTFGGLHNNIEASSLITLDLLDREDKKFLNESRSAFDIMRENFPEHVIAVKDLNTIKELFDSGRLTDETIATRSKEASKTEKGDDLPPMKLHKVLPVSVIKRKKDGKLVDQLNIPEENKNKNKEVEFQEPSKDDFYLVWQSNELKERDLNVPTGAKTNPTGSMYWKKGAYENIDQRHYFRDEVFADLNWIIDKKITHYERATGIFKIYTNGKYRGQFPLKLSNNINTKSKTYQQNNSMTQVSWGEAKEHIAKRSLLGRVMYLYRKDTSPPTYMMKID